ncbi:hypothetical protein SK128_008582 [Halocaridina rubra]|uniref:Uncharacterized protein n=1 Tax=Halocaridina rubra TaxID=373956 RepID=A0AAN9A302_HALRR
MSESGSNVAKEVKVSDQLEKKKKRRRRSEKNKSTVVEENDPVAEPAIQELKTDEDDLHVKNEEVPHPNGNNDRDNISEMPDTQVQLTITTDITPASLPNYPTSSKNEVPREVEVLCSDKDKSLPEANTEEHNVKTKQEIQYDKSTLKLSDASEELKKAVKSEGKLTKGEESKKSLLGADQKSLKPKTTLTTLAKMPTLTSGAVGGVRLLSGGVRGTNVPLLVSMGAGTPGIPLLPAGLPPGRYVILPGTSTTTKTTCATVHTTSGSMAPRLATGVTPPIATIATTPTTSAAALNVVTSSSAAVATLARSKSVVTPTIQIHPRAASTRERGRRKSYTTGEKLAMIEAVEAGQRKSTVADRFGVAPSTLACILAQRNKIRAEQDNLSRRRFRHLKYMQEDGRVITSSSKVMRSSVVPPTLQTLTPTSEQPFTHFLASLTAPSPNVFDSPPEEIIAVPDLMDRIDGGGEGGGGGNTSGENEMRGEEEPDEDQEGKMDEGLGTMLHNRTSAPDLDIRHETIQSTRHALRRQNPDALEEPSTPENSERPSTPCNPNQGLAGPYLLKKETHCSTVLDQLLRDDTYTDVTLTAEGLSLRAHRIVLCLSSPYFRQVLSREQSVQSVVLLRDVKFAELRNIINFIYTGEATVDAADLESFMRTAEMLEITSLCEGHKFISNRGLSHGSSVSGFTIGDFERLVGSKSSNKDISPPPNKTRRISVDGGTSSHCSSTETSGNPNPLTLMNEEPSYILPSTSQSIKEEISNTAPPETLSITETTDGENVKSRGDKRKKRKRRHSSESIGGFAAIAGVQKVSLEADEEDEVFSTESKSSQNQAGAESSKYMSNDVDNTASPGRCPYCPHVNQTYEGVSMMRHLLVTHPCKPAFPCSFCWRVFVKRANFKTHLQNCQDSY